VAVTVTRGAAPYTNAEPIATSGFNAPVLIDLFDRGSPDLFIGVLGGAYNPNATAADNFHNYLNDGQRAAHQEDE
jgi:hypothetical protein